MAKEKKLKSGNWRVLIFDYTDDNGKRHYKSFTATTKKEAEYEASLFKVQERIDGSDITVEKAFENYIKQHNALLSPYTIRSYKGIYRNHLSKLADIKLDRLNQETIQSFINSAASKVSPKTVRNIHGLLTALFKAYRPNFVPYTCLPKKIKTNLYIPNDEDIKRLLTAVKGTNMELPIMLASFCLMRRGEICALEREDISGNIIHVKHSLVKLESGEWAKKAPKTYNGNRYIECPGFILDLLPETGRVTHLSPDRISDEFRRLIKKHKLEKFRFHDLRHYSASILHAMGIPDKYIMERGGWASNSTLQNVYQHTLRGKDREMNSKINLYFEAMQHEIQHEN